MSEQLIKNLQQIRRLADETLTLLQATQTPPLVENTTQLQPGLVDEAAFYDHLRTTNVLGPKISPKEFQGCKLILECCSRDFLGRADTAYLLATAYHETAGRMEPIDEYGGDAYFTRLYDVKGIKPERARQMGNTEPGDGIKYHGRGFIQLTWKNNYKKAGEVLGINLVDNPELAKDPGVAAQILVLGCNLGWFTGKKLGDFESFFDKRKVVNGTDKAEHIAEIAQVFAKALEQGGWK